MPRILKIAMIILIVILPVSGALFFATRQKLRQAAPRDAAALIEAVREQEPAPAASSAPTVAPTRFNPPPADLPATPADPAVQLRADMEQLTRLFAERFGAFSNQSSISSLASLTALMASPLQAFVADEEARLRAAYPDPFVPYYLQTRVLNVKEIQFNPEGGTASFLAATQRVEAQGIAANRRTFYQDLEVRLTKEDELWKVAGAYWRPVADAR